MQDEVLSQDVVLSHLKFGEKMQNAYIVTGVLTDNHTVQLDEEMPLAGVKVRLVIEPLAEQKEQSYQSVLAMIRKHQEQRGHQPPTRADVDTYLQEERNLWEN